ncbi:NAD-dependent epimerase/dehydratase family protein [Beggiatoa alba]|nr:NAD-dependent epimerase/dehydratase family protein [Beggiatoa alba]
MGNQKKSSFEFHELDLLDGLPASILEDIDTVVHLADVVGGIKYVFDNQLDVFNLNVTIDANTVRAVANSKVKKYIYAATACSFTHQLQNSVDSMPYEKDKFPEDPESPYGWSKLVGELQSI